MYSFRVVVLKLCIISGWYLEAVRHFGLLTWSCASLTPMNGSTIGTLQINNDASKCVTEFHYSTHTRCFQSARTLWRTKGKGEHTFDGAFPWTLDPRVGPACTSLTEGKALACGLPKLLDFTFLALNCKHWIDGCKQWQANTITKQAMYY